MNFIARAPAFAGSRPVKSDNEAYLNTKELAKTLGLSTSFFEKGRWQGKGPAYFKIGNRVLYRKSDIDAWLAGQYQAVEGKQ